MRRYPRKTSGVRNPSGLRRLDMSMTKYPVRSLVAAFLIATCSAPPASVPTVAPLASLPTASPPTASPAAVASPNPPGPRLVHISTVTAVDTANAWVVTTEPTPAPDMGLLRTQDGGATWRVVSTSLP